MPSQITPNVTIVVGTVDTENLTVETSLEQLSEVAERINTHLTTLSGLDLEQGES